MCQSLATGKTPIYAYAQCHIDSIWMICTLLQIDIMTVVIPLTGTYALEQERDNAWLLTTEGHHTFSIFVVDSTFNVGDFDTTITTYTNICYLVSPTHQNYQHMIRQITS